MFSNQLGKDMEEQLLSYGKIRFNFVRNFQTVFHSSVPFCNSFSNEWMSLLPHILLHIHYAKRTDNTTIDIVSSFCIMVSHCNFNLYFSNGIWYDSNIFVYTYLQFTHSFLKRCLFRLSAHFKLGCLTFYWVLIFLCFANIFTQSVACIFIPLALTFSKTLAKTF